MSPDAWPRHGIFSGMSSNSEHARKLIMCHGWNATAYQLLNPGMEHWYSPAGDALVGYVTAGRTRVVAGAPVCATERLPAVVEEFGIGRARVRLSATSRRRSGSKGLTASSPNSSRTRGRRS